jgi:hypothetical protein
MANALYPNWKQELLQGTSNTSLAGNVKAMLVDTNDISYDATDEFVADLTGAGIVARSGNLGTKTFVDGLFDAANATFTAATGDQSEAIILFVDSGADASSRLVAWFDTGVTGLPATPNGGDIVCQFHASGIFQL